ncbi:MAG: hypothetical protein HFF69_06355 [Oscillospiraceae bacterium]|jgi:hypothetical protein|nr:hypothetical protein [Oscillospiraceae bacterium]
MACILSKAERQKLEEALATATPYTEEEMCVLDGEHDFDRSRATIAQKLLKMADESKEQHHD